ncbi:MAG: ATP-binding protein [Victivallaceae bacterium]|nr:ATP-binding protein [Victivallaceae bacterium]
METTLQIHGLPESAADPTVLAVFRSRLLSAYHDFATKAHASPYICIGTPPPEPREDPPGFTGCEAKAPLYSFDQLVLPDNTRDAIIEAVQVLKVETIVFDQWGLRQIEPFPKTALNFFGPPGTGKTLSAHAIARFLDKKILIASYAELESKYHGDGPKNVKAIFQEAEKSGAVLFLDEADSLLSKRLTNVTQGSEQAINSMRSQLLINLEQFHGVVIFATNLIQNYDKAFETRVTHIEFKMPDKSCREKIWRQHLPASLPRAGDVDPEKLSEIENVCGRDIRNAVIRAAVGAALNSRVITLDDLKRAVMEIKSSRYGNGDKEPVEITREDKKFFAKAAKKAIRRMKKKRKRS